MAEVDSRTDKSSGVYSAGMGMGCEAQGMERVSDLTEKRAALGVIWLSSRSSSKTEAILVDS